LADFKAVRERNVFCAQKNLFQESMGLGTLITDIYQMLTEEEPQMTYLYKLQ
jgi:iron complex transport system substrate-binding protein